MNDAELFSAAQAAAGYESTERFAAEVLGVDPRNARRWKTGERELQGTARVVCLAILARPAIAAELKAALRVASGHIHAEWSVLDQQSGKVIVTRPNVPPKE